MVLEISMTQLIRAAELGNVTGEPKVVYMNRASLSKLLLGSDSGQSSKAQQFVSYFEESPYGKILALNLEYSCLRSRIPLRYRIIYA